MKHLKYLLFLLLFSNLSTSNLYTKCDIYLSEKVVNNQNDSSVTDLPLNGQNVIQLGWTEHRELMNNPQLENSSVPLSSSSSSLDSEVKNLTYNQIKSKFERHVGYNKETNIHIFTNFDYYGSWDFRLFIRELAGYDDFIFEYNKKFECHRDRKQYRHTGKNGGLDEREFVEYIQSEVSRINNRLHA